MITCKQATEWVDSKDDIELSWKQKFDLKLHLLLCKLCNDYAKKSKVLDFFIKQIFGDKYKHIENPELQEKIKLELENKNQ